MTFCESTRLDRIRELTIELNGLREEMAGALDELSEYVLLWRRQRIHFANTAFAEALGYDRDDVEQMDWIDLVVPEERQDVHDVVVSTIWQGKPIHDLTVTHLASDGSRVPILWRSSAPSPNGYSLALGIDP